MNTDRLPYWEDILTKYCSEVNKALYPKNIPNKAFVYSISTYHLFGVAFIFWGLFLPPHLIPYYLFYVALIAVSYYIFDNYCFLTLLANKLSGKKASALKIRMHTAQNLLLISTYLAFVFYFFPQFSFFNLLKKFTQSF